MRWWVVIAVLLAVPAAGAQAAERYVPIPISLGNYGSGGDAAVGYVGAASDGSGVYFATLASLVPEDGDSAVDAYVRRGAKLELVSGPAPGATDSGAGSVNVRKSSADGSTVVFQASDPLSPDDTDDGATDLYEHSGGVTRLVSVPQTPPDFEFPFISPLVDISADGRFVAFTTTQVLSDDDSDFDQDVYVYDRDTGVPMLASGTDSGAVSLLRAGRVPGADGERVYMQTTAALRPALDTDSASDIYSYDTKTGAIALETPGTADTPVFDDISADGTHLFFSTEEKLVAEDTDNGARDVYQHANHATTLISTAPDVPPGDEPAGFQKSSANGSIVYFTTPETLDPAADTDGGVDDIYRRNADGTVSLVSTGPAETLTFFNAIFATISPDGRHAFFYTSQDLTADDTDGGATDAYEHFDDTTTRVSVGEQNDDAVEDGSFAGFSQDLSRLFFSSTGRMTSDDEDSKDDLYARHDGHTTLVTPSPAPCALLPSTRCEPIYHGVSDDGRRMWIDSDESLHPIDEDDGATDVYESRLAVPGTVSPALEVSDPYDDVFSATVRIASGAQPGDSLSYSGGIAGSVNGGGDVLTLSGRATDAEYTAALRAVEFHGTAPGVRTIVYSVDNGTGPGPGASREVTIAAPPGEEPPSVKEPEPMPGPHPPVPPAPIVIAIRDTGDWVAHLRPHRVFRVPGLVFYCPGRAASACEASVEVPGAGARGSVIVPPGETRGIRLHASRRAARRVHRRGRMRLRASATYSLAGSNTSTAVKRFRLLARR